MNWFRKIMYGRYGSDNLNLAFIIFYIIMAGITLLSKNSIFMWIGYVGLVLSIVRMFSKTIYKRQRENQMFLKATKPLVSWIVRQKNKIKNGRTHKYFDCPKCKMHLRAPRKKGSITVTCPRCKHSFVKRT